MTYKQEVEGNEPSDSLGQRSKEWCGMCGGVTITRRGISKCEGLRGNATVCEVNAERHEMRRCENGRGTRRGTGRNAISQLDKLTGLYLKTRSQRAHWLYRKRGERTDRVVKTLDPDWRGMGTVQFAGECFSGLLQVLWYAIY